MHTLLDLRGSIPIFVDITEGSVHDVNSLDKMPVEPGSYCAMDKQQLTELEEEHAGDDGLLSG